MRIRRKKQQADLEARKARSAEAAQRRAEAEAEAAADEAEAEVEDPLARLKRRTATKSSSGGRRRGKKKPTDSGEKAGKKPTVWRDGSQRNKKATAAEVAALDRSGAHGDAAAQQAAQDRHLEEMRGTYLASNGEKAAWDEEEELLLEDESDDEAAPKSWFGRNVGNLLNNVAGSQTLTKE